MARFRYYFEAGVWEGRDVLLAVCRGRDAVAFLCMVRAAVAGAFDIIDFTTGNAA